MATSSVRFSGGTLLIDGPAGALCGALWDPSLGARRAPAYLFGTLAKRADAAGDVLAGDLRMGWTREPKPYVHLALRPYQEEALAAWRKAGDRGIVALPTGAGKTRVAVAAICALGVPALVLVPTRPLLKDWARQLHELLGERIGVVGDNESSFERVTVMTFESAYRRLDTCGDRFGLLVVDEVHHFASGARSEALEASAATARLGLSATAPTVGSEGAQRLADLVGPVVIEVEVEALAGTHLAPFDVICIPIELTQAERDRYDRQSRPFIDARRQYFRDNRRSDYRTMLHDIGRTKEGRRLLRDYGSAVRIACFPQAKRQLVTHLLGRHREDRAIVFTAHVEDAYAIATENLIPAITGEVRTKERQRILEAFRAGRLRAIASARVLNEGIDVPDARIAIVASGSLGAREHVQRIGRVLRPAPRKRAVIYELVTRNTVDERIAAGRKRRKEEPDAPAY